MGEIIINIDVMLAKRKMSVTELSKRLGISIVNASILKNGKAKGIKFETLSKLCDILKCQPGDLLEYRETIFETNHGANSETPRPQIQR